MRERSRICFVIPSLERGGTERQLLYLLRGLAEAKDLCVICTREKGALWQEAAKFAEVRALGLSSAWDPRLRHRMQQAFVVWRPDIVHSFMFGFDYQVNVAARKADVPVVLSSRRQLATWKRPRHVRLQKKANALVDGIVANSEAVAAFASEQEDEPRERYKVIRNGVDANVFQDPGNSVRVAERLSIPSSRKVIGMVANFSPVKDHDLFVRMAVELLRCRDDLHFLLVGEGPLKVTIDEQIRAAGLSNSFTIASAEDDIADYYALMSVAVLCSKAEGSPNAVMEAMAAGKPVVAAKVGGVPELIAEGVTGRLIESRSPADFADAIEDLLEDPEEAARIGAAAASYVGESLSVDRMVGEYSALYAELLERASSSAAQA